jgi:hypothetical protein
VSNQPTTCYSEEVVDALAVNKRLESQLDAALVTVAIIASTMT